MGEHLPVSRFFSEGSDSATPEADQGVSVVQRFRGGVGLRLPTHGDAFKVSSGKMIPTLSSLEVGTPRSPKKLKATPRFSGLGFRV